jgi:HlyD family secretion protein
MKHWKTWAIVAIIVLVGAGVLLALRMRNASQQQTSFTQLVAVERGNLVATITPTGEVSTERRASLSFDVSRIELIELNVVAGQQVREGEVLARIDTAALARAVDQAEADLLSAEEALAEANSPYTELDRQKAELDVAMAEAALQEARQTLDDLQSPSTTPTEEAERALQQARANLAALQTNSSTQEQMDRLQVLANEAEVKHGALLQSDLTTELGRDRLLLAYNRMIDTRDSLEVAKARAALDMLNAQDKVTAAEKALAEAQAGSNTLALAQAQNKVTQAEYNLAKAKETLSALLAGPDAKALQLAEGKYEAAKATLEDAQAALQAATMVAPFDATVISVGAKVGDLVSSNTNIVTLADLTDLQVLAVVDETDISQVEVGQDVQITFDAFPGRVFQGKVLEVPLEGNLAQNVVTYEVLVSLEGAEGVSLRSGMTANLSIVLGRRQDVLLVPVLAVWQADEGNVVIVQASPDVTVEMPVEVGLSDGVYVEVNGGLIEGDMVVVEYQSADDQTNFFGGFGSTRPNSLVVPGGRMIR